MDRPWPLFLSALLAAACSRGQAAPTIDPAPSSATAVGHGFPPPEGPVKALREAVLASSQALDTVRSLTDEAGPRLSGSRGNEIAVEWAKRAFVAQGFTNVRAEPVMVPHWERGEERGELVSPHLQPLALAALGGSVPTAPGGLEAEVIEVGSLDAVDKLDPRAVAGKIVFYNVVMERTRDGSGYGRAVGARSQGAIRAAKLGAVGVVIRSVGTDDNRLPHTGGMRYDDKVTRIPAAALAIPDAEMLHRILASGQPVRLRMSLGCRTLPDAPSANVMGDVVGSAAPGEIVLLGAHLDSWDLGRGALDDGAGCGVVLEAGRQIGRLARHPRRTVRVVLFANEENGLAGAKAYAKAHAEELGHHVLALEADLGGGRVYEARFLGPTSARAAFGRVVAAVTPLGIALAEGDAEGGADLIPLFGQGVPAMDLRQDATLYFDIHHTANDTIEHLRKEDLDQVAAAFAAAAHAAADSTDDFGRVPEDKRSGGH